MFTLFFELFFLILPKLTLIFDILIGSILALLFLPNYLSYWFPNASQYIAFEIAYWLYFAVLATVAVVFLIHSIRKLPTIIQTSKSHLESFTGKQWFGLGLAIFLIIFPGVLAANSVDFVFAGDGGIGFSIMMTIFFFVIAGHAAVLIFLVFALWNGLLRLAQHLPILSKLLALIPKQLAKGIQIIFLLYPLVTGIAAMGWFLTEGTDSPQASRFFTINAAIKNTCFIDPERVNCPHTLAEISYIEPHEYSTMTECCQVNYQYNAATNQYSLVIRYLPTKAVVFDWRLTHESGVDFKEYDLTLMGQDRLINPPEWEGPWEFPDWPYLH